MATKFDQVTLANLIKHIDKTPAVTWTGKGGVKERILELMEAPTTEGDSK
jgi:hypothetical protein